jgi:predicted Zn-dependent protease
LLCAAFALSACWDINRFQVASPAPSPTKPNRVVTQTPAAEREHERILTSYGGAYDDPRLEALIGKTVDRLVAASDRPDQAYKVTILNSGAVNAFALPTGQLYVTRGLVALASDTSELSSVLSHEMAHVLAKHASIREDQARQAAIVTRVVTDMGNDPDLTALALAKTKLTMASFSRAQEFEADGIGVGISARAHFDPYGASRFLTSMERNAALKAGKTSLDPRVQDFLSSHPATPERIQNAQANARQYTSPEGGERDRETYLAAIDNLVYGEDPSEGFVRGRRFLHPKLGFTFAAPENFTLDNTAQAASTWYACRPNSRSASISIPAGWKASTRPRPRISPSTASRRHPRTRTASNGNSGSMRCVSAPMSTASFSPPGRRPPRATATPARP